MLFAISYDDSEVINNVSRQQPFQFMKQTVAHIHIIKNFLPNPFSDPSVARSLRSLWPTRFARCGPLASLAAAKLHSQQGRAQDF